MTANRTATGARQERCSPSASRPPKKEGIPGTMPAATVLVVRSSPNARAAKTVVASPVGWMKTCLIRWKDEFNKIRRRSSCVRDWQSTVRPARLDPFGTIKHHWDQGYFLTRKLPNVRAETALTILASSMKRTIKILGVRKMIEALA